MTRVRWPDRIVYSADLDGLADGPTGAVQVDHAPPRAGRVLFDLAADADEQINLCLDPAFDDVRARLYEQLDRMIRAAGHCRWRADALSACATVGMWS